MARGLNKVMIIGRLGQDPEVKSLPSGDAVVNISVATDESYKGKDGNKVEKTEWHRVTMFGKLAEIAGEYLNKGSQVYIEGKLETRKWQDQEGNDRYATEIKAFQMQMLGGKSDGGQTQQQPPAQQQASKLRGEPASAQPAANNNFDDFDDDIPF